MEYEPLDLPHYQLTALYGQPRGSHPTIAHRQGEEATGKEKKRRKLDSIISGLCAKTTSAPSAAGSASVSVSQRDMTPSVSITPVPRAAGPLPPPAHGPRDDLFPDITLSRSSRRGQETAALPAHDMHKPDSKVGQGTGRLCW